MREKFIPSIFEKCITLWITKVQNVFLPNLGYECHNAEQSYTEMNKPLFPRMHLQLPQ